MRATLTIPERHMLERMLHAHRDAPFDAALLNRLRSRGLVEGATLRRKDGRLSRNYRWTITDAGRAAITGKAQSPTGLEARSFG